MTQEALHQTEFCRPTAITAIGANDLPFKIDLRNGEKRALAERLGVKAVNQLWAKGFLRKEPKGRIRLTGQLFAEVLQDSIVSFAEVSTRIEDKFNLLLCPEGDPLLTVKEGEDGVLYLDRDDDIDLLIGDHVDVGEQVVQLVSLAIDPYPRGQEEASIAEIPEVSEIAKRAKGNITFDLFEHADHPDAKENPFMALKKLRQ